MFLKSSLQVIIEGATPLKMKPFFSVQIDKLIKMIISMKKGTPSLLVMLVVKTTNIVVVLILVLCNFLFRYIPGMEVTLSSRLKSLYSIYCKVLLLIYCKICVVCTIMNLNLRRSVPWTYFKWP